MHNVMTMGLAIFPLLWECLQQALGTDTAPSWNS